MSGQRLEKSEIGIFNAILIIQVVSIYLLDAMYKQDKKLMLFWSSIDVSSPFLEIVLDSLVV